MNIKGILKFINFEPGMNIPIVKIIDYQSAEGKVKYWEISSNPILCTGF